MKKTIFSVMALTAIVIGSASCAKEDPAQPLNQYSSLNNENSATVSGILLVNPDETKAYADQKYAALANAKIKVTVSNADLYGGAASGDWASFVTTDLKGEFTVNIPATVGGVTVSFAVSDTKGSQKRRVGADEKTVDGYWTFHTFNESVQSGMTYIHAKEVGSFNILVGDGSLVSAN
jgi:hypothetical protein